GCVAWMFGQKGRIAVKKEAQGEEELLERVMEAGADDMQVLDDTYEIITAVDQFDLVRKALEEAGIPLEESGLTRIPQTMVQVDEKNARQLLRLMDLLEDHEDIQKSYSNFDIPDAVLAVIAEES
ncbi:MAG: YebC/PmpR family DNA-binding transcriptional regulator, partial [Nitrospinae bacterium CG11_big_fil_rev_8_21_14_0_20_56_8]